MRKHSPNERSQKLAEASLMASQGVTQSAIAKEIGVSVMTLHRWKHVEDAASIVPDNPAGHGASAALADENRRLRQIVIDLLLETERLKETHR
jgi:transposase-like protein